VLCLPCVLCVYLISIIINPISGGARPDAGRARVAVARAVAARWKLDAEIVVTEAAGHARAVAERAVNAGADRIVAWGGDGTINEVASALASTAVPMGIVPAG